MRRFNRRNCIVCECHSGEEVAVFVKYCNARFLSPDRRRDPESFARTMFGNTHSTSNCIRYQDGDMGHCRKTYYIENGYRIYDFADLDFEEFSLIDCAVEYDNSELNSFILAL